MKLPGFIHPSSDTTARHNNVTPIIYRLQQVSGNSLKAIKHQKARCINLVCVIIPITTPFHHVLAYQGIFAYYNELPLPSRSLAGHLLRPQMVLYKQLG